MVDHNEPPTFPPSDGIPEKYKPFGELTDELNKESSRGCVLVSASYLDIMLKDILEAFFVEGRAAQLLNGFEKPLGSFAARVSACHALGLISQGEFEEIECLRGIRNKFAHGVGTSFGTDSITDRCRNLKMGLGTVNDDGARKVFTTSIVNVILNLIHRAERVGGQRRIVVQWPLTSPKRRG